MPGCFGTAPMWLGRRLAFSLAEAGLAYADLSAQGLELMVVDLRLRYSRRWPMAAVGSAVVAASGRSALPFMTRFLKPMGL